LSQFYIYDKKGQFSGERGITGLMFEKRDVAVAATINTPQHNNSSIKEVK